MKKFGLLVLSLLGFSITFYAQQDWCGTDAYLHKQIEKDPAFATQFSEHYIRIKNGESERQDRSDPIIIPVVVHVIHDNGIGNISYDQILSGIEQLNIDFNRQNADTIDTRNTTEAPFLGVSANIGIEFALAKIDPDGNCTNGIERRNSPNATYNAGENAKYYSSGGLDAWDRSKYMNVWIVNSIESDGGGMTLGYAQFPQAADDGYGVIIRHDYYGNIGTANGDRTLTHEIGHCLGLLHTFQGPIFGAGSGCHTTECSSTDIFVHHGDFICDTPPAAESHWNCPPTHNSCTDVPIDDFYGFDAYDQWENYMSYAPCQNMFSEGQKTMILGNLTTIAFLANLVSLSNQTATGVTAPAVLCQADFYSDIQTACAGNQIQFSDASYFNVTGWNWSFPGGSPASSTDQNPVVTYPTGGNFSVTLEVTDGVSTETTTATNYLLILSDPGDMLPYKEDFENLTTVPDNDRFMVENSNGGAAWTMNTTVGCAGPNCAALSNFGVTDNSTDDLISGTIDLSGVSASDDMIFTFKYAYKRRTSSDLEKLRFYISKDCGETWVLRKNIQGSTLGPEISTTAFTPSSDEDWTEVSITNITSDYYVADFRYKFEFVNNSGNNIYIDYINMYPESMTGLEQLETTTNFSLYPNPVNDLLQINYTLLNETVCKVTVRNALGQIIAVLVDGDALKGSNTIEYSAELLSSGIYFVNIETETSIETLQFVKHQ